MFDSLTDLLTAHPGAKETAAPDAAFRPERRRRARTRVHWPVRLLKDGASRFIETVTHNLSSSGFYCLSPVALTPGEALICTLRLPAHDPRSEQRTISLECRALVMRAEATSDGSFGIACRIEDYHLISGSLPPD
jgi:hypothetical protein